MPVRSQLSLCSRVVRLCARGVLAIAALPLAACNGGADAPRDGSSGGGRPVFFISAVDTGGAPRELSAPGDGHPSFFF